MPRREVALPGSAGDSPVLDGWSSVRIARAGMDSDVDAVMGPDGGVPDLILLDLPTTAPPTWTALEACREDDRLKIVPIIVMGEFTDDASLQRAYELRANCCVRRPADPILLRQRLQVVLGFWLGVATLSTWRMRRERPPKLPPAMIPRGGERPRILMIDDVTAEGRLVHEALRLGGVCADLSLARTGADGLAHCRLAPPPHLILLDLHLGAEAGHDVLARLKSEPMTKTTPTLVLSSSRQESDIRLAYECWANGYLTKPPAFDGLLELMRRVAAFWLGTVVLPPTPARSRREERAP